VGIPSLTAGIAAAAAVTAAAATVWAGGSLDGASSRPDFVTDACLSERHAAACDVALRYLASLDLDQGREACAMLAPSTLANAGGLAGCAETVAAARGIRIRYSLVSVAQTALGTTVHFTTRGESEASIPQTMLVSDAGRIVAVIPAMD
jgi:hypothetical protein